MSEIMKRDEIALRGRPWHWPRVGQGVDLRSHQGICRDQRRLPQLEVTSEAGVGWRSGKGVERKCLNPYARRRRGPEFVITAVTAPPA